MNGFIALDLGGAAASPHGGPASRPGRTHDGPAPEARRAPPDHRARVFGAGEAARLLHLVRLLSPGIGARDAAATVAALDAAAVGDVDMVDGPVANAVRSLLARLDEEAGGDWMAAGTSRQRAAVGAVDPARLALPVDAFFPDVAARRDERRPADRVRSGLLDLG